VRALCAKAGIVDIDAYYVTRTYLTRHGAGPLPGEDPELNYADDTNAENQYQGRLRFAHLDNLMLHKRCSTDFGSDDYGIVFTHCDQLANYHKWNADYESFGPTRDDVKRA
jgi:adenylosuccinate synthase